jgi:hypothetical protein
VRIWNSIVLGDPAPVIQAIILWIDHCCLSFESVCGRL